MENFKDIAAGVVTDHEAKRYSSGQAAGHVVEAIQRYGKWVVLAAATLIESKPDEFEDIPADQIMDFLEESYLGSGATVGEALKEYAEDDLKSGRNGELGRLYDALDRAGGVERFDWDSYADDDMTPTTGLHFVVMPVPTGEPGTFIFGS